MTCQTDDCQGCAYCRDEKARPAALSPGLVVCEPEACPVCGARVEPEHAHGRCSKCHAMVYTCCDGGRP